MMAYHADGQEVDMEVTMRMMDLDSNGRVSALELVNFLQLMTDMDGRTDLLPSGASRADKSDKRKGKRKRQTTKPTKSKSSSRTRTVPPRNEGKKQAASQQQHMVDLDEL